MKRIGIITAMTNEAEALLWYLDLTKKTVRNHLIIYSNKEHNLELVVCGMGLANASRAAAYLIKDNCEFLVNAGFCGANHPDLTIGDVVSPSKSIEQDLCIESLGNFAAGYTFPKVIDLEGHEHQRGIACFSVSRFQTEPLENWQQYAETGYIVDMELHSVANLASFFNVPLVAYKIVSDNTNADAAKDFAASIEQIRKEAFEDIASKILALR